MKAVWKFPLEISDTQNVFMPPGAEILTAQMQADELCLWAVVTPGPMTERRTIEIVGTGNPMPEAERRYIATVQMGAFVWHVFEQP